MRGQMKKKGEEALLLEYKKCFNDTYKDENEKLAAASAIYEVCYSHNMFSIPWKICKNELFILKQRKSKSKIKICHN